VEDKRGEFLGPQIEGFRTRRINFTFRYVPFEHIKSFKQLPLPLQEDVDGYMRTLAESSAFFKSQL
jgi:hypothetical protein